MSLPVRIRDEFRELSPAERSATTASFLSQIADLMLDNNKRIFSKVLDMIAETEGDEKLHLDMLATHLAMETSEVVDVHSWDVPEITSLSEYRARSRLGEDSGVCPRLSGSYDYTAGYLQSLEIAVRRNASRDLLGSMAESLQLPAEYSEFLEQASGVVYPNLDKQMFVCSFSTALYDADEQAQPLEKIYRSAGCSGFEVAAGWKAGDNDQNCWIYYLLCKDDEEPDEPWQWRIFINNIDYQDVNYFDSLRDFLAWYCNAYDWVDWKAVQEGVHSLHQSCEEALAED